MDEIRAITVKQLNFYAKSIIENDRNLRSVTVKGELSNFVLHERSGHAYFTLKDDVASVKSVMFSSDVKKLSFVPETGMKVFVHGRVSLYERDGQFQLYADSILLQGIGDAYLKFEELKEKLSKEGLFSEEYKKPLPLFPENVGVITSPTGAAIQDFINVTKKRCPSVNLQLYPVNVQGERTVPDVMAALSYFEKNPVDVIVITRGGGSYEDLSEFNSEILARRVFEMKIPVVSAIGHEIDFTILDFVSDLRAPTPSAAAESVIPDRFMVSGLLTEKKKRIEKTLKSRIENERLKLSLCFEKTDISGKIRNESQRLDGLYSSLLKITETKSSGEYSKLKLFSEKINALNPISVLTRGFAIPIKDGKPVNTVTKVLKGDILTVKMKDGEIDCAAEEIRRNEL